jgi:hypothetical protein
MTCGKRPSGNDPTGTTGTVLPRCKGDLSIDTAHGCLLLVLVLSVSAPLMTLQMKCSSCCLAVALTTNVIITGSGI